MTGKQKAKLKFSFPAMRLSLQPRCNIVERKKFMEYTQVKKKSLEVTEHKDYSNFNN